MREIQQPGQSDSQFEAVALTMKYADEDITVPNGTRCQQLVADYKSHAKKNCESVLGMAKAVATAVKEFKDDEQTFKDFCNGVGLDPEGSTFRKFKVIGENATRFAPHLDKLPASWTTLYGLANIETSDFDKVAKHKTFGPKMTAKQIRAITKKSKGKKFDTSKAKYNFIVKLQGEPAKLKDLVEQLQAALKPLGLEGEPSEKLQGVLDAYKPEAMAA